MNNLSLVSFSAPEIPAAGTSLGLTFASAFGANWLLDKAATKFTNSKFNPMNRFINYIDSYVENNANLYQTQADEIEKLKIEIANLQRMKENQKAMEEIMQKQQQMQEQEEIKNKKKTSFFKKRK